MADAGHIVRTLQALPRAERRDALAAVVVEEFKSTLLMPEDEDLPVDQSFFDLGFTSLRITEAKQRLEALLDRPISANVLFNSPTVDELVAYLAAEVLADVFEQGAVTVRATLWDNVTEAAYGR
ncbi:MAG TPA: acyl carrier protein [Pseudonocardiaceae bacterium]|jgi:acyl carrier protein|nr:acyl carrier protein [Pseudonocardiaceae bacterium]